MIFLARLGYATKGLLYILIGGLALRLALGYGGSAEDASGAVGIIGEQPFGKGLLMLMAFGFACHALWRFTQAVFDVEGKGRALKGVAVRLSYAAIGVTYATLAWLSTREALLDVPASAAQGEGAQTWTARILALPYGMALVVLAGATVALVGLWNLKRAAGDEFLRKLTMREMSASEIRGAKLAGRIGLAARSATFGIIAWFLIKAGLDYDPSVAHGLREALLELARQPNGSVLLGLVSTGLVAYGVHCLVQARYRRLQGA